MATAPVSYTRRISTTALHGLIAPALPKDMAVGGLQEHAGVHWVCKV